MGHDICINENTGKASVFVVKEPAWHGLGQVVPEALTAKDAIVQAGLDWDVIKSPVYFGENKIEILNKHAIVRIDNNVPIGIVGKEYTPIQNREAFTFFDPLVSNKEAIYHSAGALGKGERVWILAKLPIDTVIGKDDLIENYLLIFNTHDASSALTVLLTPIRVVCNNTLTAALRSATNRVSIRHTQNAHDNLFEAHRLLGLSNRYRQEVKDVFNFLSSKQINQTLLNKTLEELFSFTDGEGNFKQFNGKIKEKIVDIFESNVGGQDSLTCRGTAFGLYNAVSFYYDNVREYKNADRRAITNWFGSGVNMKQKAFDKILKAVS